MNFSLIFPCCRLNMRHKTMVFFYICAINTFAWNELVYFTLVSDGVTLSMLSGELLKSANHSKTHLQYNHLIPFLYCTISDINECLSNNGNCSQTCTNTNGSYICSCRLGYAIDANNHSCNGKFDINDILVTILSTKQNRY